MPSATVHLKIAYMMKSELGIKSEADFYMGAIAPDSVNLKGFASEEVRYSAHIRSKDYDKWKNNIRKFYADNKDSYMGSADFLKGYVFHLCTDIAWDEVVQPHLFNYFKKQGYPEAEFKEHKWAEHYRLNGVLAEQPWYSTVIDRLKKADSYDIAGISAEMVKEYRDYVINAYQYEKMDMTKPEYLQENFIYAAAIKAVEYFESL